MLKNSNPRMPLTLWVNGLTVNLKAHNFVMNNEKRQRTEYEFNTVEELREYLKK
jgi:hypothetical protein